MINEDTGEGWKPEINEEGELETPPDWVLENNEVLEDFIADGTYQWVDPGANDDEAADTVIVNQDMCQSPLNEWIATDSQLSVGEEIQNPFIRDELVNEISTWIDQKLANHLDSLDTDIDINAEPATIEELACNTCDMSYAQCLLEYQDGWYCKRYIYCNMVPSSTGSYIELTVPLWTNFLNLSGSLNVTGKVHYQETLKPSGKIIRERCLLVDDHQADGFGAVNNTFVEHEFEAALDDQGRLCRRAGPDPSP